MEELRGTDALDREILDDARRKAGRIVKAAEKTIAQRKSANEQQLQAALETERARFDKKFEEFRSEMEALLELDKARIKTERFDSLLRGAAETYLRSLSGAQKKACIDGILEKRLSFAFDGEAAAVDAVVDKAGATDAAITLDFPESSIHVSIEEEIIFLLSEKRGELTVALLDGVAEGGGNG
ncbi:MAG: hypothetical protein LBD20_07390 [Spirochaetaceae bacterium]|jgi:hypothetical protein|nr:hypothetical protein [Spirochaetaceae bacterium]